MDLHRHLCSAQEAHGFKFDCSQKLQRNKPGKQNPSRASQMFFNFIRTHNESTAAPRGFKSLKKKAISAKAVLTSAISWYISTEVTHVKCKLTVMVTNTQLDMTLFWICNERSKWDHEIMEKSKLVSDNLCQSVSGSYSLTCKDVK